jgi:UDP-2,4-diacetamido-2,4,6-trideoxy-beta-L-altropyranose hydrolase
MTPGLLLIRADANVATGTGHVMRCLALAQAWQDTGGRALFAIAETTPAVSARLQAEGFDSVSLPEATGAHSDASRLALLAHEKGAKRVVVDGYQFEAPYQRELKLAGLKILFVDDNSHAGGYAADLVLNQNPHATARMYEPREPYTRLLLGTRYCMLRREFNAWREYSREIPIRGRKLLVAMGGSDPENLTARAIEALSQLRLEGLEATVVVGGSNPHFALLERSAAEARQKIVVRRDVSNMAELMAWADVAVSAAGSTCWELCLLALPALLVDVAENQIAVARELHRRGCALHLGSSRDVSAEKIAYELERLLGSEEIRRSLSSRSRELVDGQGAARVVSALLVGDLRLRAAQKDDSHLLWKWANDPQVRAASFSSDPIPWERHELWFSSKMRNSDCRILIAEDEDGKAVGQFRVDWRSSQDGDLDISLSPESRGRGYGARLIDLGVASASAERGGGRLHAFVKPENQASRRAFESAGFRNSGMEDVSGQRAVHYVFVRQNQS